MSRQYAVRNQGVVRREGERATSHNYFWETNVMTAKKNPLQQEFMVIMTDNTALPELIRQHTESILQAQTELLEGFEEIANDFLDRRRADNETAIKAVEKIYGSGDMGDMLVAYFDWLGGSVRRLTDDAAALSEQAFAVAASAAKAGRNGASLTPSASKAKTKTRPKRKSKPKKAQAKPQPVVQEVHSAESTAKERLAG